MQVLYNYDKYHYAGLHEQFTCSMIKNVHVMAFNAFL